MEYPQFIDFFAGTTLFKYEAHGSNDLGEVKDDMKPGISAGLRLVKQNDGFYTNCWEFLFSTQNFDQSYIDNQSYQIYQISWIPTIRIPLWTYISSLPDYTSISIGYAFGLGISNVDYKKSDGKEDNSASLGICSSAVLGFRIGLSESVSIITDVRYSPFVFNRYIFRKQEIDDENRWIRDGLYGPSIYLGISLAP